MTDVTTLPDAGSGDLAAGYVYLWVPGSPATQFKVAISVLVSLGLSTASWKEPVRVATTSAHTLATDFENGDTIDGVVLATGDRILIKNQASASENGIYTVNSSGAPSRSSDADTGSELVNAAVVVSEGTVNGDSVFTCTTNAPINVGTTGLTWSAISTSTGLLAANNLSDVSDPAAARANLGTDQWALNFTADGDVYIPADVAMTIEQGNAEIGTGTITFQKSTTAAPSTFGSTTLPATLQAGAWLKVSAASVSGFCATHLKRTA